MDNNHQKFDSQSIANRVRELFLHYGIGKRQHARELSRILDLSFSHAHRKLKGQSPWTLEQINSVAAALGETPAAIADLSAEHEAAEPNMARDAIFFVAGVAMPSFLWQGSRCLASGTSATSFPPGGRRNLWRCASRGNGISIAPMRRRQGRVMASS
ncbi:helix-turn-helix domain-containing protein [Serratia marcescens]|uniref:helix-turn-helix domain-containing protein n=1 Tax=Serratia marcescens TaxID=615 RepID=UPI0038D3D6CA